MRLIVFDCANDDLLRLFKEEHLKQNRMPYSGRLVHYRNDLEESTLAVLILKIQKIVKISTIIRVTQKDGEEAVLIQPGNYEASTGRVVEYKTMDEKPQYRLMIGPECGYVLGQTVDGKATLERAFDTFDKENIVNVHANIDDTPLSPERILDVLNNHVDAEHGYAEMKVKDGDGTAASKE